MDILFLPVTGIEQASLGRLCRGVHVAQLGLVHMNLTLEVFLPEQSATARPVEGDDEEAETYRSS